MVLERARISVGRQKKTTARFKRKRLWPERMRLEGRALACSGPGESFYFMADGDQVLSKSDESSPLLLIYSCY